MTAVQEVAGIATRFLIAAQDLKGSIRQTAAKIAADVLTRTELATNTADSR